MKRNYCTLFILILFASVGFAQTGAGSYGGALSGQPGTNDRTIDCTMNPLSPGCSGGGASAGVPSPSVEIRSPSGITRYDDRDFRDDYRSQLATSSATTSRDKAYPPEPPTEFQRFVAESTGARLPVFGGNLFQNVPSTFAPVVNMPVSPDYILGPGDELRIRSWGQLNTDVFVTVDRSGQIYFPKVGSILVSGVRFGQVSALLKAEVGKFYKNFDLTVSTGRLRSIQIFVMGFSRRPGSYTVGSMSTLLNALFASGGPSLTGSLRKIQLKRGDQLVTELDLYDFLLKGDKSRDVRLEPGDVIFVPPIGPVIAITGSVQTPAIYELRARTKLRDILTMVGGINTTADVQKIIVERIDNHRVRTVQEFQLDQEGLAQELKDGDIVQVTSIVPKFENAVTIRGNVANPGRYPWHEGMKLRDLIPNREFLLTREYWRNQNLLGSPFAARAGAESWERQNRSAAALSEGTGEVQQEPVSPSKTAAENDTAGQSTGFESLAAASVASGQAPTPGAESKAQTRPSVTPMKSSDFPDTRGLDASIDIKKSAPDINWDYAAIQRLNHDDLSTQLLSFNLGRLTLGNDESQNLPLRPGDVITIFSQRDLQVPMERRTKFVRLEGEVRAPGVYRVEAGETLQTIVNRAGGLTPGAFLYGADFTRESLKREQQRGLDATIRSIEIAMASQGIPEGSLITKLRQLRANGRMVLELRPSDATLGALPQLALEDGDRLAIPSKPTTVDVVGAVFSQSSYIYRFEKNVGDYLRMAGRGTREADRKHMFLIRADGSVISRGAGMWSGGFESLRVLPGDVIVVPLKLVPRGERLRAMQQWSQLFSQFALGAASLAVVAGR